MIRFSIIVVALTLAACATTTPDFDTHPTDAGLFAEVLVDYPGCEAPLPQELFGSDTFATFESFADYCAGTADFDGRSCLVDDVIAIADGSTTGVELRDLREREMRRLLDRECR